MIRMGIGRGEMGSEGCKENMVKFVKTSSLSTTKLSTDIPEWLLVEVLTRLPVKLVFMFKLVSKQWLSVISDPSFIRMYLSRASMSPQLQTCTFISPHMHVDGCQPSKFTQYELLVDVYSQDLKLPSMYVLPCPLTDHAHGKNYVIGGISNGLVLFVPGVCSKDCSNYYIHNPITRQCIALPPHAQCFKICSRSFVTHVENGILTNYRVVRLEFTYKRSKVTKFEVFISEIGEWKDFTVHTDQAIQVVGGQIPTTLNGIIHWITRRHGIIAYDPYEKPDCLRFIALPSDVDPSCNNKSYNTPGLCEAHQGRLRYFEVSNILIYLHGFSSFGVWLLNDYSTGDWCLQHKINSADVLYDDVLYTRYLKLVPISFHPFDPEIVYLGYCNIIVSYDMKNKKLEAYGGPVDTRRDCIGWWFTFMLVVPPWPISVNPIEVL